jgi:hypothetical protein
MHAPWGQLLAYGIKDVENRSWATAYRGPVALHCTKGGASTREAIQAIAEMVEEELLEADQAREIAGRIETDRGKVIGVAEIVGCMPSDRHPSRWAMPGGSALELARVRLVAPIEVRGVRGIVDIDPALAAKLAPLLELGPGPCDVIEASEAWGANCGPTAIAGALGLTLDQVRPAVVGSDGKFKGYMGARDLRAAIERAGGQIVRTWSRPDKRELAKTDGSPIVVLIRFCGPWDAVPRAAAKYRHAFCYRHGYVEPLERAAQRARGPGWVLDVNSVVPTESGQYTTQWLPLWQWRNRVLTELIPERGTGATVIDWMAQVRRSASPHDSVIRGFES